MEKIHTGKIITLKYSFAKEDTDIVKVQRNKNDSVIRNARKPNQNWKGPFWRGSDQEDQEASDSQDPSCDGPYQKCGLQRAGLAS